MSAPVAVPKRVDVLEPFVHAGLFAPADVQVAGAITRLLPALTPPVQLAIALAVRATRLSHVCVMLDQVPSSLVLEHAEHESDALADLPWPAPAEWVAALRSSDAVTVVPTQEAAVSAPPAAASTPPPPVRPLVLSGTRLYLERYWRYERQVGDDLLRRASAAPEPDTTAAGAALDRLFPPSAGTPPDLQRAAAAVALSHRLAVIAGGPGTGKTHTVARLLAAAWAGALDAGHVLDVALAAPTGKAAARMTEAIHHEADDVALTSDVAARLRAAEATTIHRLLGRRDTTRFRRDHRDPVPADIVVIDEASMVSLPLMAKLLDAVRPDATLVLVGDPYQLASIEAGAVLGDVVGGALVGASGPLRPNVVVLERVHRFAAGSAIAALADAVRTGRADDALDLLRAGGPQLRWVRPDDEVARAHVEAEVLDGARLVMRAARAGDVATGLAAATDLKVLAAVRRGPLGTAGWQERIERLLARTEPAARVHERWYPGRPVIVTRNDPLNGLVNGATGLVVEQDAHRWVAFPEAGGVRLLQPSQLAAVETWWAMTIHKSQGSEYRRIVLSLPDAGAPILTRELLYTAITRAREQVVLVASEAAVRAAIDRPVTRASGLGARLWS